MNAWTSGGKKELYRWIKGFNIKVCQQTRAVLFHWFTVAISQSFAVNRKQTTGGSCPTETDVINLGVLFVIYKIFLLRCVPWQNTFISSFWISAAHRCDVPLLPEQVRLLRFLRTAGECQDLEHVSEGTSISGLGDENHTSQEKDQEGDPEAYSGKDVAKLETNVLLDVGHTSQWQDGSQVNAPVEPVEESTSGLWSPVFDLWPHTAQGDGNESDTRADYFTAKHEVRL